jgi:signal transduction histidine kinase/CheY-like chemotaxis protein
VNARHDAERERDRAHVALEIARAAAWDIDLTQNRAISASPELAHILRRDITKNLPTANELDWIHRDDRTKVVQFFLTVLTCHAAMSCEHRILWPDGEVRWIRKVVCGVRAGVGGVQRLACLTINITEEKQLEQALSDALSQAEQAVRGKRQLLEGDRVDAAPEQAGALSLAGMTARLLELLGQLGGLDRAIATLVETVDCARTDAEAANIAKSVFLANVTHELRTPLNAVIGYAELLLDEVDVDKSGARDDLHRILIAGRQLLGLINDTLDLSRVELGRAELEQSKFDLAGLVRHVCDAHEPAARQFANAIYFNSSDAQIWVNADASKLRQCVHHLISNAVKFTQGGRIDVSVGVAAGDVVISVADTGVGMSQDQMAGLFEPFRQAEEGATRRFGGVGLGFAVTMRLMRLVNGDLNAESAPGKGSRVVLRLPIGDISAPHEGVLESESFSAPANENDYVLIIEDDDDARALNVRQLAAAFRVKTAACAFEGLAIARSAPPAAIVLDLVLPDLPGLEALSVLKTDPKSAAIPVIAVSCANSRKQAIARGAGAFLLKPLDRTTLLSEIVHAISRARNPNVAA